MNNYSETVNTIFIANRWCHAKHVEFSYTYQSVGLYMADDRRKCSSVDIIVLDADSLAANQLTENALSNCFDGDILNLVFWVSKKPPKKTLKNLFSQKNIFYCSRMKEAIRLLLLLQIAFEKDNFLALNASDVRFLLERATKRSIFYVEKKGNGKDLALEIQRKWLLQGCGEGDILFCFVGSVLDICDINETMRKFLGGITSGRNILITFLSLNMDERPEGVIVITANKKDVTSAYDDFEWFFPDDMK